ncbi:MAG: hypothetical protein GC168_09100 [Candidatus Hydrogenedens sp.]|nr:hypothetical protein [Candidatus Hydrogenedens sp.]
MAYAENTADGDKGAAGLSVLLPPAKLAAAIGLGVGLWFVAAMWMRYSVPMGFYGGSAGVISFAAFVPVAWGLLQAIKLMLRLTPGEVVSAFAVGTGAATLCDGTAFTWFPTLYGPDPALHTVTAAYILWGAGVGLVVAYADACWMVSRRG